MEDYLMHGEENSNNAIYDNTVIADTESAIYDDLVGIVDCGKSAKDFKDLYGNICDTLSNASFDYVFYDFTLIDELDDCLDDMNSCYFDWKHGNKYNSKSDTQRAFDYDMSVIKDYANDYKTSKDKTGTLLDL